MSETVHVAVPIPGEGLYSYSVPAHLREGIALGKRVLVPFRNRRTIGFIVGSGQPPPDIELRDALDIIDDEPLFDNKRLEFLKWVADYYMTSLGIVLKAAHPGGLGVSLKQLIKITDNGRRAVDQGRFTAHELLVLRTILNSGEISSQKLQSLVENTSSELLNSLRRRGLVEFEYEVKSDPKIKTEKIISTAPEARLDDPLLKRKKTKSQILEYLLANGRVPLDDLKEVFGNVSVHLAWLGENGFIAIEHEEISRDPFAHIEIKEDRRPALSIDQEIACGKIRDAVESGKYEPFLLHGVTGSGKTEVYLRAIEEVIGRGKEAILLVPEISLTPLLVKRVRARFGNKVAVIHSALSDGERFDAWRVASRGEVMVVICARSAIFAPFANIGIIVVDEEHETTYKQEETPCYNARDLALVLGKMSDSVVVLGSATPSAESYYNALKRKFTYLSLPLRVKDRPLPSVEVADMKYESGAVFSGILREALVGNFWHDRQTILFLNRRGYSTLIVCPVCGEIMKCPNCSVSLTYHSRDDMVRCHMCGLAEKLTGACLKCGESVRGLGIGTQKVEEELKRIIPEARAARMDRDTVAGKKSLLSLYSRLERGEIDVLIGTQMVAKGHDLPGVTLVGVISADISLGIPDFRSGERTFQLVTQVAGRSGRGDTPGRVIVQTYNPEHPSIRYAVRQDSKGFLEEELRLREELGYPPFSRLLNVRFTGKNERETGDVAERAGVTARKLVTKLKPGALHILGPSPCPVSKVRNRYRFQILLKSTNAGLLRSFTKKLMKLVSNLAGGVRVSVDIDPYNFS
ncbi:MAG: primosomal protein N' [Thermodesulfobacteriota bacterium]